MAIELRDTEDIIVDKRRSYLKKAAVAVISFVAVLLVFTTLVFKHNSSPDIDESQLCPIHNKRAPISYYKDNSTVEYILKDEGFKNASVEKLSLAIQIDTSVYDNAPEVSEDPEYWKNFAKFHKYLESTFPSVFSTLTVEKINSYGLILTWEGSNSTLKPLLLTAHQDVVPVQVETIKDWDYPPFEGHFDGKLIFGRGAGDCKNLLVALLETLEIVIEQKFSPKRTLVLAFGADEEISGNIFASKIGEELEKKYGPDSFYAIIDEGAGSLEKLGDLYIASPATAEKGYMDINFELTTPGGHSSVPPDHTSIGIISDLITLLEENPFEPLLTTSNPALEYLQCIAKYSDSIEPGLKKNILRAGFDKIANSKAVQYFNNNKYLKYLIRTSQAVDIIQGGAKSNALPEHVSVIVNHRISFESSTQKTYDRSLGFVEQIAKKYDLGIILTDGSEYLKPTANGYFTVSTVQGSEPTRVSPTSSDVWSLYSGALRHLYEDLIFEGLVDRPIVVAPNVPTGNTDTRHYLNLSQHIYRSIPGYADFSLLESGVHSVNEKIDFDMHLQVIAFYYEYLQLVLDEEAN